MSSVSSDIKRRESHLFFIHYKLGVQVFMHTLLQLVVWIDVNMWVLRVLIVLIFEVGGM
jgi:hypothetical protein